ncbi:MAG: PAS domain S-box protein [Desulfobacteraceae bacterium]
MNREENDQDRLHQIAWLLERSVKPSEEETPYEPPYGDVTALNTCRVILDCVGKETLKEIAEDSIDLLGTSVAVYEANGDYAFGMFASGWCRFMDAASRALCQTEDNGEALRCGKWLCHENCWNDSAKAAIETGRSTDIPCVGGIHLYGEPIYAGGRVVGAINIGYGNPPMEPERLKALAKTFKVDPQDLREVAAAYASRPTFIVDVATKRLASSARLIGRIVERAEAEEALRKSEQKYQELFDSVSDLIFTQDLKGRFISVNSALKQLFGYEEEEIIGRKASDFMVPELKPLFESEYLQGLTREGYVDGISRYYRKDGSQIYIEYRSRLIESEQGSPYISGIGRDVTRRIAAQKEKERLESQLQQAQKMEALATLTGGIAHDYNNLLTAIMGNISLAKMELGPEESVANLLDEAEQACMKTRDLTHRLAILSKSGASIRKPGAIQEVLTQIAEQIPADLQVHCSLLIAEDLYPIHHDPHQLRLALENILTNAVEAMPQSGTVTLKAENVGDGENQEISGLPLRKGPYVRIMVQDEGVGIPEPIMDQIFDPYFSTKDRGVQKGMGLGLSIAYAIIRNHDGHITVDSVPDERTTVCIYLPAASGTASSAELGTRNGEWGGE